MKGKLKFIVPVVVLVGAFAGYTFFLKKGDPPPKVHGQVYVLPKDFVLNLKGGRFLKLGVGLLVKHGDTSVAAAGGEGTPPEGYGTMPQEALVRDIVTGHLTDAPASDLIDRKKRETIKHEIKTDLRKRTDVKVEEVLFTDIAVQ